MKRCFFTFLLLSCFQITCCYAQIITTVAGAGAFGFSGDGGPAINAAFWTVVSVALDKNHNLYIADHSNYRIRKVDGVTGIVTTVAGNGTAGYSGDGGPATASMLNDPSGIAIDASNNIYIADYHNNRIRKVNAATGIITTVAGNGTVGFSGDGGVATSARLSQPAGVAVDADNNIYIADYTNHRIRKVDAATGIITTVAGNGIAGFLNDGTIATNATLSQPNDVFVDANKNLLIADYANNRIRRVDAVTHIMTTIAGTGVQNYNGDGHLALTTNITAPTGVTMDANGNIYIADLSQRILKIDAATGLITTAAGNGTQGFSGDGGPPKAAQLYNSWDVTADTNGDLYIADLANERVRKIAACVAPVITQQATNALICGSGDASFTIQANGALSYQWQYKYGGYWQSFYDNYMYTGAYTNSLGVTHITPDMDYMQYRCLVTNACGTTQSAEDTINFFTPSSILVQIHASNNPVCGGIPVTFSALPARGAAIASYQWKLNGMNTGVATATYTNTNPHTGDVVTCTLSGSTVCTAMQLLPADSVSMIVIPATKIALKTSGACLGDSLTVSFTGAVSKFEWYNSSSIVKTVTPPDGYNADGYTLTDPQGTNPDKLWYAPAVYVDVNGNVYVADQGNYRVRKFAAGGSTGVTVAGGNGAGYGPTQLNSAYAVWVDGSDNVYVVDQRNNRVQRWAPGATVGTTVAGGMNGFGADQLDNPLAIYMDGDNNIYIADGYNHRIQKWAPGATVGTTVAGGNGMGNAASQFAIPSGVFVDAAGNIFVADAGNNRIQKWTPGATVGTTVAGGNGKGNGANQFDFPTGIFVDPAGNIFVTDQNNNRIQKWAPGATTGITVAGGHGFGNAPNQLATPNGVFLDVKGNMYVADWSAHRVQKFTPLPIVDTVYKPTMPGLYYVQAVLASGCIASSDGFVINPTVAPSVGIAASTTVDACTPVKFIATPVNGGSAPAYQWKINGVNAGTNAPDYTSSTLKTGDVVSCVMTGNAFCSVPATATSNSIAVTINSQPVASISIAAAATAVCTGNTAAFTATAVNGGTSPVYQWQINGVDAGTNNKQFNSTAIKNGDVVSCSLISNNTCVANPMAHSNSISMTVNDTTSISPLTINHPPGNICRGIPVSFTASAGGNNNSISYQWQINGVNTGANASTLTSNRFTNGDIVSCMATAPGGCATATSNNIVLTVYETPVIKGGQVFTVHGGHVLTLDPVVSGNITSYQWSPSAGLSDNAIKNPVASPAKTTSYMLTVRSDAGCKSSESIKVKVFTDVNIPNAFSPDKNGTNDVFYVLGGPDGSVVKNFMVFNRWGQQVFHSQDAPPGDPAFGWNGYQNAAMSPAGMYVYRIAILFADGTMREFKGTVLLIR